MCKKQKKINRVFISGSSYSFLIYLLISSKKEIESTFYFFGSGISETIKSYFAGQCYYFAKTKYNLSIKAVMMAMKIRLYKLFRWRFLNDLSTQYYGHDHIIFSWPIVGKNHMNIIEDGIGNYYPVGFHKAPKSWSLWLKKKFMALYILIGIYGLDVLKMLKQSI